jgi:hypothetical protein
MNTTPEHNERIAKLTFAEVYPLYLKKIIRKGRTQDELDEVITWLTGLDKKSMEDLISEKVTFEVFFNRATLNPDANQIKGVICGYRIEEIQNPLTRNIRYLDKLVDELASGRKLDKIIRTFNHQQ